MGPPSASRVGDKTECSKTPEKHERKSLGRKLKDPPGEAKRSYGEALALGH